MRVCRRWMLAGVLAAAVSAAAGAGAPAVQPPTPESAIDAPDKEQEAPDDDLATAIGDAYRANPLLAAERYELRATDDSLGLALSETRATVRGEVAAGYQLTQPGLTTEDRRPLVDRLNSRNIHDNDLATQLVIDQPITTGGRAAADVAAASGDIRAARNNLRGTEGDLLLDVVTAYSDIRRDAQVLAIRSRNQAALTATLDEVAARREAGELTRTDVAQASVQLEAAKAERNVAEAQLEDSRSAFVALVGREPGRLAPEPPLPLLPGSVEEAFDAAGRSNPELAAAIEAERASRARIASARADSRPTLSIRGVAGTTGEAVPYRHEDQDVFWSGRLVLSVPFWSGGRTTAAVAQALDRNSADRLRIEAARRRMVQQIVSAWNQMATARRNRTVLQERLKSARTFYEGTFEEYREGLRSTFDVLYAQTSFREAEIAVLAAARDEYVASAALLRQLGRLEAAKLLTGTPLHDPSAHVAAVERRSALPWDPLFRAIDRADLPPATQQPVEALQTRPGVEPRMAPAPLAPAGSELIRERPTTPIPGTAAPTIGHAP